MATSTSLVASREALLVDHRCNTLQALRLLVEGICDDVVELTPESGVLEDIIAYATTLAELTRDQAAEHQLHPADAIAQGASPPSPE